MPSIHTSRTRSKLLAPPPFLGLPDRFKEYRATQSEAVFDILDSQHHVRICNMPTGSGKTLVPVTIAMLTGQRVLVLTATRNLENQYEHLLGSMGLVDVRGAQNYRCPALERNEFGRVGYSVVRPTADHGPCRVGIHCHYREDGCPKFDAIRAARSAQIVVTNYAYWLAIGKKLLDDGEDEQLGKFDWIFPDEIHLADRMVCSAMTVEIERRQFALAQLVPPSSSEMGEWRTFAREAKVRVGGKYDELKSWLRMEYGGEGGVGEVFDELKALKQLDRSLDHILTSSERTVITRGARGVVFEPVWASSYTEPLLLRDVSNVVGMSATIRPAMMPYLGVEKFDFREYPSTFPVANRPVYFMPKYRAHWNMSERDVRLMIATGDNIFRTRDDRRTIVHSVSYKRARQIASASKYSDRIITHKPGARETERALSEFTRGREDGIFVSPAIDTGYDLPDDNAEVCWIPKCPYPSMESEVMKIRAALDRTYILRYAATQIQQMAGRVVRHEGDRGETIITDSAAGGLFKRGSELFSRWFLEAKRYATSLPKPLRKVS